MILNQHFAMGSAKMCSNHERAHVWEAHVVHVHVATSLVFALDAMSAWVAMVVAIDGAVADVADAVANHSVDRPFSVNRGPICHNRVVGVGIVLPLHADGHDGVHDDLDVQNLSNDEMMEYHFQYRRYYD